MKLKLIETVQGIKVYDARFIAVSEGATIEKAVESFHESYEFNPRVVALKTNHGYGVGVFESDVANEKTF